MTDELAFFDRLSGFDGQIQHVVVTGLKSQSVFDEHSVTVNRQEISKLNFAGIAGIDRRSAGDRIIDSTVTGWGRVAPLT